MTTSIPLCIKCARFSMPPRVSVSDGLHYCSLMIPVSRVTGKAIFPDVISNKATCEYQRGQFGICGPNGDRFTTELFAGDFDGVLDAGNASVDSHGLDESGKQHGVCCGESRAKCCVNLDNGGAQIVANDCSSQDGIVSSAAV